MLSPAGIVLHSSEARFMGFENVFSKIFKKYIFEQNLITKLKCNSEIHTKYIFYSFFKRCPSKS